MKTIKVITSACLAVAIWAAAVAAQDTAQPEQETTDVEALKKELAAAIAKQNAVVDEYNAIIRGIKKSDEIVKLDEAIDEAQKELAAVEADNDSLTTARDAELRVRAAVKAAIDEKVREHPEGSKLLAQIESIEAKRAEHQWQMALAKFQIEHKLSPIARALAANKELAKFKKLLDEAESEEEKVVAKAAHEAMRNKIIEEHPDGPRLTAMLEDAAGASLRLQESAVAIEQRLAPIRKAIERQENKRITAAREDVAAALNSDKIKELREKVNENIKAYNARVKELIDGSEDANRLKKEYDELVAKVKELRDKFAKE